LEIVNARFLVHLIRNKNLRKLDQRKEDLVDVAVDVEEVTVGDLGEVDEGVVEGVGVDVGVESQKTRNGHL
jgi:hypothetical protein